MRKQCSLLATSAASLVALSALLLVPLPLAAQYYLPGPLPSGTEIIHETERIPDPPSRTCLGIRERVFLNIVSYSDIDLWVNEEEEQEEVWDELGLVEWHNDGDGELIPQGDSATYIAPDDAEYCPDEWVWVVVHDSGNMGIDPTCSHAVHFFIYEPSGAVAWHNSDMPIGTPGFPENSMGAASGFVFQTLPNSVNFYNANLRERINPQAFSWPNTSPYYAPAQYPQAFTRALPLEDYEGSPNWCGDVVITGGPWDIDRLINPGSGVHEDCEFPVVQLLQFYSYYSWITYASPTHARRFSADTFGSQVGWGSVWGGEQGPYQEQGQ
ncbi:MAG TPA: hypothetical protein VMY37_27625 [Thermoguttaceae bacterium]|nr:hypothetical protein [Thermoguttaceae bacterium]